MLLFTGISLIGIGYMVASVLEASVTLLLVAAGPLLVLFVLLIPILVPMLLIQKASVQLSIWGSKVLVGPNAKIDDEVFDELSESDIKALEPNLFDSSVDSTKLEVVGEKIPAVSSGSIRMLLEGLQKLNEAAEQKVQILLQMFEEAKWSEFNGKFSEFKANYRHSHAESKEGKSGNLRKQAGGVAGGAVVGGGIGACFGGVGAPIGAGIGAVVGLVGGVVAGDEVYDVEPKSEDELGIEASKALGLGVNPMLGIQKLVLARSVQLSAHNIALSGTALNSFEVLLRRVVFRYSDALLMADLVSDSYERSKVQFEKVADKFDRSSETYKRASENFQKAESNFARARNAVLLAAVVTGIVEGAQEAGEMTTAQFRDELAAKGMDLSGQDIDHIIPKSKGGVDHPWNYQSVDAALNRSWQDGALFEKCRRDPIAFAKAVVINNPAGDGIFSGLIASFFGSKNKAEDEV